MKALIDKAKSCLAGLGKLTTQKIGKLNGTIKGIVIGFLAVLVMLVATFYFAWLFFLYQGKAMLGDLLELIDRVISPQMVAFITFVTTCFVDEDGDGVPDKYQTKHQEKRGDKNEKFRH